MAKRTLAKKKIISYKEVGEEKVEAKVEADKDISQDVLPQPQELQ